jgi:RHS repeat-associated protein
VGANWATPAYDRNGNMTGLPQVSEMTVLDKATWDAWNRLVTVEEPDGSGGWQKRAEYRYDGQTWRIVAKSYTSGTLTETRDLYYSAGWQVVEERGAGATQAQYVWNPMYIDALMLRDRSVLGSLNERLYAMQDANFNTVAIADATGSVKERYTYEGFGTVSVYYGSWATKISSDYQWTITFQGMKYDGKVGLYYQRIRWYSPMMGRWIIVDPMRFDANYFNFYLIEGNNPITYLDYSGMDTFKNIVSWDGSFELETNKEKNDIYKDGLSGNIIGEKAKIGIKITFTPRKQCDSCKEIKFIQFHRTRLAGGVEYVWRDDNADRNKVRTTKNKKGDVEEGWMVDYLTAGKKENEKVSMFYNDQVDAKGKTVTDTKIGSHSKDKTVPAFMKDMPGSWDYDKIKTMEFHTYAVCADPGVIPWLGGITWQIDFDGKNPPVVKQKPVGLKETTKTFVRATTMFNHFYNSGAAPEMD